MGRRGGGGGGAKRSGGGGGGLFGGGKKAAPAPSRAPAKPAPTPRSAAPPPPQAQRAAPAPAAPAPAPAQQAPPPMMQQQAPQGGGMLSGLGGMVAQGMALGVGSSVGRMAVEGVMNKFSGSGDDSPAPQQQQQPEAPQQPTFGAPVNNNQIQPGDVCGPSQKDLYTCLSEQNNQVANCQYYLDALKSCQENQQWA